MSRQLVRTRQREVDDAAARLAARLRVLVLTCATLGLALEFGEDDRLGVQYALAFVAVPAAVVVAMAADRLAPAAVATLGAAVDIFVVAVAFAAFPDDIATIGAAFLIPVIVASYTGGRAIGIATGATAVGLLAAYDGLGHLDVAPEPILLLSTGVAVTVAVVGRADARLVRSSRRASFHEERASVLLDQMAEPVVVTDGAGAITRVNRAAADFLGLVPPDAGCTALLNLHIDGTAVDCGARCGLRSIAGSRTAGGVEAEVVRSDGTPVPVLVSLAEVNGSEASPVEYIHTVRDITALKMADEAKTLFLATATHELKTPLTVIRGFLETIDRPSVSEETRAAAIRIMRQRAQELNGIIERVLLASHLESDHLAVGAAAFDIVAVARDRVAALAAATGRAIALEAGDVPLALGDAEAIAVVVDHLLDNACKYSQPTSPISVLVSTDERSVLLAVRDQGVGMTGQQMERCFDRFWQADATSRRRVGGTGIGLYIVRSLVESMGGTIGIESTPGAGSTFTVRLPRVDSEFGARGPDARAAEPEPSIVREFMRQIGVKNTDPS